MNDIDNTLECSFCGKHKDAVTKLIVGDNVAICSACVSLCHGLLSNEEPILPEAIDCTKVIDPCALTAYLDQYVVGQQKAKEVLSVAIANHYKRISNTHPSIKLDKANILMLGPTGTGKTLLVKSIAKYLDVPFAIADATSLTESGYVGDDVESLIVRLLSAADGDVEKCKHGIIFVDEIDKISRRSESASITRDVSGEGVQQALLKMVEGTVCRVPAQGGRKHPSGEIIDIDTENILFIAGGAFIGLDQIIQTRLCGTSIGFTGAISSKQSTTLDLVSADDLVKFGMIPEFVGRFPSCVGLQALTHLQLVDILTNTKNCLTEQYKYLFLLDGVTLDFTPEALLLIASRSMILNTGARGLHSEIERVLLPHMFNIAEYKKQSINHVEITAEQVNIPIALTTKGEVN
jgi:ATP-dependent Clp protease ATP-binding subunit ClpX